MDKKKRKSVYRRRIFLYFLLAAVVPILVLGMYSYYLARDAVMKNANQSNRAVLHQIENRVDNALNSIYSSCVRIAGSSLSQTMTSLTMEEAMGDLNQLNSFINGILTDQAYVDYLEGYAFVNYKNRWVLTNKGMFSIDEIRNPDFLESVSQNERNLYWLCQPDFNDENQTVYSEYIPAGYISLVVKLPLYSRTHSSGLILHVSRGQMENLMKDSLGSGRLLVFDSDGQKVYWEDDGLADYFQRNPELLMDGEDLNITTDQGEYLVSVRQSDGTGWTYMAGFNADQSNPELSRILFTMGLIVLLVTGAVVAISMAGTRRVYRPVQDLVSAITGNFSDEREKEGQDEFSLIHSEIHTLTDRNEKLSEMIDRQKGQLKELFALRLIRGRMGEEEIAQTWERLGIRQFSCFSLVSAIFCADISEESKEQTEQDALNLELMADLPEEILSLLLLPPIFYNRAIVFILGGDGPETLEEREKLLLSRLENFAGSRKGIYADLGISQAFSSKEQFRKAYHESLEALKVNDSVPAAGEEAEGNRESWVTYYKDLAGTSQTAGYNLVAETEIREAVDACDSARASRAVNEFLNGLRAEGAALTEQKYCLYRFLLAILSVPADAGIAVNDIFPQEEGDIFQRLEQLYDRKSIFNFYDKQVIRPVMEGLKKFRKSSTEMVMEKIEELVVQSAGDLTLSECADRLGYHPSYIWRVMKSTRDITFSDYVAEQKLELGKQLLKDTNLSVSDIAEKLSYSNAQNFIRVFKKHMDITPGKYRQMYRDKKDPQREEEKEKNIQN